MAKKRIVAGLVIVALAATGGIFGYREHRANSAIKAACETITAQIEERGAVVHLPGDGPSVAIIGDSYTSGDGLDDHRDAWAHHWANATASDTHIAGIGNTGYTNGGFCGTHHFQKRADALADPAVLVLQGGLNDWEASADDIRSSADALLSSVDVPTVVLIGPAPAPSRDGLELVDATLRDVAEDHGAQYISALDWDLPFLPDGLHLTEEGHKEFAGQVDAAITLP